MSVWDKSICSCGGDLSHECGCLDPNLKSFAELEFTVTDLLEENKRLRSALEKIASRWFDPVNEGGACVADCEANLPKNELHSIHCPFEIAKEALAQEGEGK